MFYILLRFRIHRCTFHIGSKSSSHGPCSLCISKKPATKSQQKLIDKTRERKKLLQKSPKVFSIESVSECEWKEQMRSDPRIIQFLSTLSFTFNSSKPTYGNDQDIVDDILNDNLQCYVHLRASVKEEYRLSCCLHFFLIT